MNVRRRNQIDSAGTWPRLGSASPLPQCAQALEIAKAAFASNAPHVFGRPGAPADAGSALVLGPEALDVSGGNAITADPLVFEKLPLGDDAGRSLYWQKEMKDGLRLALYERSMGWRGDMYFLFALARAVAPAALIAQAKADERSSTKFVPLFGDAWRPPLVLRQRQSGELWVIDVGQPYHFLGDWRVHTPGADGYKVRCTVRFRPTVKRAITLLPEPVRQFERLLDQTMGSGKNEGTLQSTARLRLEVEHMWANAAVRPWALAEPYNTRDEVDAGLRAWSRGGPAYREAYEKIRGQYPLAEKSLADYYRKNFQRPTEEAKSLAAYAIDIAFRAHYTFHSERPDRLSGPGKAPPNPWRSKQQP